MTVAAPAEPISRRIATLTAHRFDVYLYSDDRRKTRDDSLTASDDVRGFVLDPDGSVSSYACSVTSYSLGQFYFTLSNSAHSTAGDAQCDVKVNRVLMGSFKWEFVAKL